MTSVIKLNNKRFYFSGGVVSLPFSHRLITKLNDLKEDFGKNIEKVILEKNEILKFEHEAVFKNKT